MFFLGQLNEDDEKLLEEETASPANLKRYFTELIISLDELGEFV